LFGSQDVNPSLHPSPSPGWGRALLEVSSLRDYYRENYFQRKELKKLKIYKIEDTEALHEVREMEQTSPDGPGGAIEAGGSNFANSVW
jgi:hypothetical protein